MDLLVLWQEHSINPTSENKSMIWVCVLPHLLLITLLQDRLAKINVDDSINGKKEQKHIEIILVNLKATDIFI